MVEAERTDRHRRVSHTVSSLEGSEWSWKIDIGTLDSQEARDASFHDELGVNNHIVHG